MGPFSVVSPTASADGYGYSGEALIMAAVREHGADVRLVGYDWRDERYSDPELLALKVSEAEIPKWPVTVVYFLPYALTRFRSKVTLSMTMWETDRMPDIWARLCDELADGMIVPSQHCAEVFQPRVHCPVKVAPFGTDTDLHSFCDRSDHGDPFVFLMSGLLHYRKGVEFALRAFREEFAASEPVELWLKTRRNFLDVGNERQTLADPRIAIIDTDYSRERMVKMYHEADCLLAPSRGEGSGLTPRDAMATGLPVIMTDWGGLREIADPRYGWPIPVFDLEPAPLENTSYGPGVTGGGDIGNFALPDVVELRKHMRTVYEDRALRLEVGARAADWMRREWTWGKCAGRWLQTIEELSQVKA